MVEVQLIQQAMVFRFGSDEISISDDGVTLAKLASGTAGAYLGFDSSGDPTELTAPTGGTTYTAGDGIDIASDTISVDDDYIQGLAESAVVWFSHFSLGYVPHDTLNTTDPTNHEWTNEEGTGNAATVKIRPANHNRGILASMEDGALIQVRAVGSESVVGTFTITEEPAAPDSTYLYSFVGEWSDTVSFNSGTNYPLYFSRPVETNFLTGTEAADDSSEEFGWVSGAVLDTAVSEERIYQHVANILTEGANVTITPSDAANTLTIIGSAASTGGTTYTAGDGIDISSDVISVADDGVTLAKLASGTADMYLGYDSSGNPTELTAPTGGTTYTGTDGITVSGSSITLTDDGVTLAKLASGTAGTFLGYNAIGNPAELTAPTGGTTYTAGTGIDISSDEISISNDGVTGTQIADDAIDSEHIVDDSIDLAHLASGTAGRYLGYDTSGNPAELTAPTGGTTYTAGDGIDITGTVISVDGSTGGIRAERLTFAAITTGITPTARGSLTLAATGFESVVSPTGETTLEVVTAAASGTSVTFPTAGVYGIDVSATVVVSGDRGYPRLEIYADADTPGTDAPLSGLTTEYVRFDTTDTIMVGGTMYLYIDADDTAVKFSLTNAGYVDTTQTTPTYTVNAGATITVVRLGGVVVSDGSSSGTGTTYTAGTGISISSDTISIAADGVTGAQIADDSIDSEHIVDDSIDLAHLASGTADTYLGYDSSGNPAELTAPTSSGSGVDLYEDFPTEISSILVAQDRMVISDVNDTGQPNRHVRLDDLGEYFTDLRTHLPTVLALSSLSGVDRLFISDESAAGDPMRYTPLTNVSNYILDFDARITTEQASLADTDKFFYYDASASAMRYIEKSDLESELGGGGGGTTYTGSDGITVSGSAITLTDDGVTLAKLASGTAGTYLGYDTSGNPAELTAPTNGGTGTTYTGGQGIAISGSTIELADDGVISEKIADDAILTAHITDGNITRIKIAADAIDGALIADDAIANEHLGSNSRRIVQYRHRRSCGDQSGLKRRH